MGSNPDPAQKGSPLSTIATAFGLFAGIASIVYLGGGALLSLRLSFAGAPAPSIFAGQISRELVLSIGFSQVLLPLVLVAVAYLIIRALLQPKKVTPLKWWGWVLWIVLGTAAVVAPGVWFHLNWVSLRPNLTDINWPLWWWICVFAVSALTMTVAIRIREVLVSRYQAHPGSFARPRALVTMTALWTLAALPGALVFGSAVPFDAVAVCKGGEVLGGFFIGQSNDRIFIGEATTDSSRRILSLGFDGIDAVFVGGGSDCDNPVILPPTTEGTGRSGP